MIDIIRATVLSGGTLLEDRCIRCENGRIASVLPMAQYAPSGARVLDAGGLVAAAGYIDQHTHGAAGYDAMDAAAGAMDAICRHHLATGTTTFLPTTMTATLEETERVLSFLSAYRPPVPVEIAGVHMEGPFLSCGNRGAHPAALLTLPDDGWRELIERYRGFVRLITLSPELPGMPDFIRWCVSRGVVVSGGHDEGWDEAIDPAIDAGMRSVTHIFCCTSGITREGSPRKRLGLTEIGLLDERLFTEAIADGNGVPHALLPLLFRAKGRERVIFISDSMRATGLAPGRYRLGGAEDGVDVDVTEQAAILHGQNLYAGSIAPVSKMVADAVQKSGVPLADALLAATGNPAALLGLTDRGDIAPGYRDAINLIASDGTLKQTVVSGRVYVKGEEIA
ncbi:MAG: amidohydrolase family protein [Clostridiales bacterium]|nr:amidohydrolase family protein [Clostridiales bacterium]